MSATASRRRRLVISGRPMSSPLRNVRRLAQEMVSHFVENVAPCGTMPGDVVRGDITTITKHCIELAIGMLDGRHRPEHLIRLERAAEEWAREAVPLDTILHAVHAGFTIGLELIASPGRYRSAAHAQQRDLDSLVEAVKLLVEMLDVITGAITMAYIREMRAVAAEHHTAAHTLTSALLGGHATSVMARQCGITVAPRYAVLAIHIPAHPDESNPDISGHVVARRKLRRIQAALADRCGREVLALLSVDGGTILLPTTSFTDHDLDNLLTHLDEAGRITITAAVVTADRTDIPAATERAHQLLDTATRLDLPGGLYRFEQMALEFQLSRPGPARDHITEILDPLHDYPELLSTLRIHIGNDLDRQRTAAQLGVHPNTIDYRLKKVARLTGHDPGSSTGIWKLTSALTAYGYHTAPPSDS
ncbi:PucR family transcriptional regulator [Nocardia aurea]|uniref:Helix-turn-helix domain-containing protein n=1 Tax=Nocardia aurea TaxID=2144174 RepID=A0ABV3FY26_9NOCA